jgi:hypothetical protein
MSDAGDAAAHVGLAVNSMTMVTGAQPAHLTDSSNHLTEVAMRARANGARYEHGPRLQNQWLSFRNYIQEKVMEHIRFTCSSRRMTLLVTRHKNIVRAA